MNSKSCRSLICRKLRFRNTPGHWKYAGGARYCTACANYLETIENRCPCCGRRLRIKSRNRKYRVDEKRIE